jgi:hypothetical protein
MKPAARSWIGPPFAVGEHTAAVTIIPVRHGAQNIELIQLIWRYAVSFRPHGAEKPRILFRIRFRIARRQLR